MTGEPSGPAKWMDPLRLLEPLVAKLKTPQQALIAIVYLALLVAFLASGGTLGIVGFAVLAVVGVVVLVVVVWVPPPSPQSEVVDLVDYCELAGHLDANTQQAVQHVLRAAALKAARQLEMQPELVRCNVFARTGRHTLRIVPALTHNMVAGPEMSIEMPVGVGSNGRAFETRQPNIAVSRSRWTDSAVPPSEGAKLNRQLKWVVSVPMFRGSDRSEPAWVLNIDGLQTPKSDAELRPLVGWACLSAELLSETLDSTLVGVAHGAR